MNILLSFDSGYFLPALVLLRSLLLNNRWCGRITVYVLYLNLTDGEIRRFSAAAEEFGNGSAVFIRVPEDAFADAPLHLGWITRETYFRLLAQELLPETVERFLYLDVDTVVCGSLEEFYNQDFEGNLLVACASPRAFRPDARTMQQLTLPADTVYFNAGVLLHDLKAQRQEIDPAVYREYPVLFYNQLKFNDQDVLNAVFYGMTKIADFRRYNLFDSYIHTPVDAEWALLNTRIFHFNGMGKPWQEAYWGLMGRLFWAYAVAIPEYAARQETLMSAHGAFRERYERERKEKQIEG